MNVLKNLLEIFIPRNCAVCGEKLLSGEDSVCTCCLADFPRTFFAGERFNPMSERLDSLLSREFEDDRPDRTPAFVYAAACFYYRDGWKNITRSLKYDGFRGPVRLVSGMFSRELAESPLFSDVTHIVPVPLHWSRRLKRGYNQAETIACSLLRGLNERQGRKVECCPDLLRRIRRTRSQASLDKSQKESNVAGAFAVDVREFQRILYGRRTGQSDSDGINVKILLVDDVFTTGATLAECCLALQKAASGIGAPGVRLAAAVLAFAG